MCKCRYCEVDLSNETRSHKANHMRWCVKNPRQLNGDEASTQLKIKSAVRDSLTSRGLGIKVTMSIPCKSCGNVIERLRSIKDNSKLPNFCSAKCSSRMSQEVGCQFCQRTISNAGGLTRHEKHCQKIPIEYSS